MKYFFAFGNTPDLSRLELSLVYPFLKLQTVTKTWVSASCEADDQFSAIQAMQTLGGTVKIAQLVKAWSKDTPEAEITEAIKQTYLDKTTNGKITFVFAQNQPIFDLDLAQIKTFLKEQQIKTRYIEASNRGVAAAVWLNQKNLVELLLVHTEDEIYLIQTLAMQDIDDWTKKDRHKPYADRKKGMLPPKLARMMVNLALTDRNFDQKPRLLDPFCGTATVLMEAALLNCVTYGSDLDYESVLGSMRNMDWLIEEYQLKKNYHFVRRDVTQLKVTDFPDKIDSIVTEPFLGKQTPNPKKLPNIFKGLEKMYLGAFANWQKILNDHARVVIVFPRVESSGKIYSLTNLIDKLAAKGYTQQVAPVIYARQGAIVQREIHIFDYHKG